MYKYSQDLRERLQKHFKEKYGTIVTDDEADVYLDSLARLFDAFKK